MRELYYYGHGKLMLTGEYLVLDGAKSLALPTVYGQKMYVSHRPSNNPTLTWKSYNVKGECWLETKFELWHFNVIENESDASLILSNILKEARKLNIHFLRDDVDVLVETQLEFPLEWGLGSSSSLIYNIAQWAYVSPFELQLQTFNGSGYDIACAQSMGPIKFQLQSRGPHWETVNFNPHFQKNIYFVYLNKKQNSRAGIARYRDLVTENKDTLISEINDITEKLVDAVDLKEFEDLLFQHENIISQALNMPRSKETYFSDYWGAIKSLGAWGGDFVLVTSDRSEEETKRYFINKGFDTILNFEDLILQNFNKLSVEANLEKVNSVSI